jgi:hypothetical protein
MTTEATARPSFLGIEIHGDINEGDKRKAQRPMTDLAPIVQAVLDDPTVVEFGWRQYTPYFNDGDPCTFRANGAWVRLDTDRPADDEEYEDLDIDYHPGIGKRPYNWQTKETGAYEGPDEARYDRLHALGDAIDGGEFLDVLLATFGDHAEVTVRRDGIQVDEYSHD